KKATKMLGIFVLIFGVSHSPKFTQTSIRYRQLEKYMKTNRRFTRNRFLSHLRIATAGMLIIVAAIACLAAMTTPMVRAGGAQTYIVLYKTQSVSMDAANAIANAGGVVVASYNAIGVVIARL